MLSRVHKISVLLYLSSLVLLVCWGISLKELLMEQVIVATLFISAILWLITGYKKLGKATKIYLFFYPSYLLLATLLFFTERIMFVVLLIPFWTFILPQSSLLSKDNYEIRVVPCVLSVPRTVLYEHYFIFEKSLGYAKLQQGNSDAKWSDLHIISNDGSSIRISVKINGTDTGLVFK